MTGIWVLGCLSILGLFFFIPPVVLRSKKAAHRTEALNNARQIGLALMEFDTDYGCFPDASTVAPVKAATSTPLTLGDASSNQLFRQLIAAGLGSEKPFYAKGGSSRRPDDHFSTATDALAAGECGFAYVAGLKESDHPATPLVMASMIRGTDRFDPKGLEGRGVVLRVDNSATPHALDAIGHATGGGGMSLFDPLQPFWKGRKPDLKWQE